MPLTSFTPGQVHERGPEGARRLPQEAAQCKGRGGSGSRGRHHRPRRGGGCPDGGTAAYLCQRPVGAGGADHACVARDAVSLRHPHIPEGILAPHDGGREGVPDVAGGRRPGYRSRGLGGRHPGGAGRRAAAAAAAAAASWRGGCVRPRARKTPSSSSSSFGAAAAPGGAGRRAAAPLKTPSSSSSGAAA